MHRAVRNGDQDTRSDSREKKLLRTKDKMTWFLSLGTSANRFRPVNWAGTPSISYGTDNTREAEQHWGLKGRPWGRIPRGQPRPGTQTMRPHRGHDTKKSSTFCPQNTFTSNLTLNRTFKAYNSPNVLVNNLLNDTSPSFTVGFWAVRGCFLNKYVISA